MGKIWDGPEGGSRGSSYFLEVLLVTQGGSDEALNQGVPSQAPSYPSGSHTYGERMLAAHRLLTRWAQYLP
jgi:hypothetical protein